MKIAWPIAYAPELSIRFAGEDTTENASKSETNRDFCNLWDGHSELKGMKAIFLMMAVAVGLLPTRADGLKQSLVPANSRWVLHLDAEAFRKSRIGAMIVEDIGR